MSLNEISPGVFSAGRLPNNTEKATAWRDGELTATDWIIPTTDHPQHAAYIVYRQALRDWPATDDFPTTKPTI